MIIKTTVISIILTISGSLAHEEDQLLNALTECIKELKNDAKDGADQTHGSNVDQRHLITPYNPSLALLRDNFETKMSERTDAIQQQFAQQLGDLSDRLSAAIENVRLTMSQNVEALTQRLTPIVDKPSPQHNPIVDKPSPQHNNSNKHQGQIKNPNNKELPNNTDNTKEVRDVLGPFFPQLQKKITEDMDNQSATAQEGANTDKLDQVLEELLSKLIPILKDGFRKVSQMSSEMALKACVK